jgi:predicted nucleic acid-binding protein
MILVDTSIWIDHLSKPHWILRGLLMQDGVLVHPFVLGELAVGSIRDRDLVLITLSEIETVRVANHEEVLNFISAHKLFGKGIGYIDANLLTSVVLTPGTTLWTRDKRLHAAALELKVAYQPLAN